LAGTAGLAVFWRWMPCGSCRVLIAALSGLGVGWARRPSRTDAHLDSGSRGHPLSAAALVLLPAGPIRCSLRRSIWWASPWTLREGWPRWRSSFWSRSRGRCLP